MFDLPCKSDSEPLLGAGYLMHKPPTADIPIGDLCVMQAFSRERQKTSRTQRTTLTLINLIGILRVLLLLHLLLNS